ncbi:MAG: ATP-binding protein [Clostridia bacterium]|nr:ATP-binding protein [Clostridia bacterium]
MGYPKEIYDIVKDRFESRRFEAKNRREMHKKEIYGKIPRIVEIDKELRRLGLAILGNAFTAESSTISPEQAREKSVALNNERMDLLESNGFSRDYLSTVYTCSKCMDTGIVKSGYCECFKKELTKEAHKMANLPLMTDTQTFDSFGIENYPEEYREDMQAVLKHCIKFAESFEQKNGENLYMYGSPGLGKTHLSGCIAKAVIDKGYSVFYQPAYKIFRIFEDYKFNSENKQLNKAHIDRIMNTDLLIIDDLGAEMSTSFTAEVLFDLINTRINSKQSTIISTNLDFPELETIYSERISSRIFGSYTLLEFNGDDLR